MGVKDKITNASEVLHMMWLVLVVSLGLIYSENAFSQQVSSREKILVLFGGRSFSPLMSDVTFGLRDYLNNNPSGYPTPRLSLEFLHLDDFSVAERPEIILEMLKHRQQTDPATLVISITEAAQFLLTYGEELYPGLPKFYVVPSLAFSQSENAQSIEQDHILVRNAELAVERTLALIPTLLPELKQMVVISGSSDVDSYFTRFIATYLDSIEIGKPINYVTGLPLDELESLIADLPKGSVVFTATYLMDRDGNALSMLDVISRVVAAANVPLFVPLEAKYAQGAVGGSFANAQMIGRRAGEMAMAELISGDLSKVPALTTGYWFDHRQLQRWGIDESSLPSDSVIENLEVSAFELYRKEIFFMLAVMALLLFCAILFKKQARNLGTQKTLFESVINSIPDAILITDNGTKIFATNKGAKEIFGFTEDELLGMDTSSLIDESESSHTGYAGIVDPEGKSIEPHIFTYKKQNGDRFSGETIATKIVTASGEVLGHFALIRDISKRLRIEEEQRQGQKMEALGNLVGGISHDFNNVLGVISGYAELLQISKKAASTEKHLLKILKATRRAKALVRQIMTFSRDTSSEHLPIDLPALLDETMKLIKVSIPSSIETRMEVTGDISPVLGSLVQIQEIIMNLTTNAYQAMKDTGGSITTIIKSQRVTEQIILSHGVVEVGDYCVLSVVDSGPGMSTAIAERIFEPFFTTKEQGHGSGMGMTIVYNLVKSHHAVLNLKTAPGHGTCVSIYFKQIAGVAVASNEQGLQPLTVGNGERVLLVDDEKDLLDSACQLLTNIGYDVLAFSDSSEALLRFKSAPEEFDILVTDESMPRITGIQLLEEIRKLSPDIPAIICTGYSELLDEVDIERMNLSAVLRKPCSIEEISRTINAALSEKNKVLSAKTG